MAHYFESGFFVRERAWHGLGTTLQNAPDNTKEAIELAGLDWPVTMQPVFARVPVAGGDLELPCDDAMAVVRERGNGEEVLAVVGSRYTPLQNHDAFKWFDPLLHDKDCTLEAAGSVKGGRHVWVLARVNGADGHVGKNPDDVVRPYLLLSNSHDGTRAVTIAFTPIRVVCWNTLSAANHAADDDSKHARKVRHTIGAGLKLDNIRESLNLELRDFSSKVALWRELGKCQVTQEQQVRAYARKVFAPVADRNKPAGELEEVRAEIPVARLFYRGPGSDSAGQTAFGLYQAATHYIDHERGRTEDTRLAATWFGDGKLLRDRAETCAMELAGIS